MTLIKLVQRASILAGMTFAGLAVHSHAVQADTPQFCVVASNGKTSCGTLKAVERACVTTDAGGTVCGKFKSAREEQAQEPRQEESKSSTLSAGYRKELDGVTYTLRSCKREESSVKCNLVITAKKEGKELFIRTGKGYSSMVDSNGRTYPSSNLEYNGEKITLARNGISLGVDYVMDISFENIPGQVMKAALVNIKTNVSVAQFRNVPIVN